MTSLEIVELRLTIQEICNRSDASAELKRMILSDLCNQYSQMAQQEVNEQLKEREEKANEQDVQ